MSTRYWATYHRAGRYWTIDVTGHDPERGNWRVGVTSARLGRGEIRANAEDLVEVMCGETDADVLVVKAR